MIQQDGRATSVLIDIQRWLRFSRTARTALQLIAYAALPQLVRSVTTRAEPISHPAVRNKPQEGDQDVSGERQARIDEGQDNREHVGHDRDLAFPIGSEGLSQLRVPALGADDDRLEDRKGYRGHQE